jgi:hypothetical protein
MGAFLVVLAGIAIPLIIAYKGKGSRRVWAGMILISIANDTFVSDIKEGIR